MDGEEVRGVSRVTTGANGSAPSWTLKLPFLCARPGNVGVQIDSHRAMKLFNRPRCGKFTEHFLGLQFENSSMENYSRVVERTSRRARIVEDRLAKLRAREQDILDDEQRRQHKRVERESARQRKLWLHHQSMKKREQRQREEAAAMLIQRCARGMLARRERDERLQEKVHDQAARTLQRSSRSFVARRRKRRRFLEKQKEKQMQAATVLQRQTRKRLALAARKRLVKLDSVELSNRHPSPEKCEVLVSIQSPPKPSPVKSAQLPSEELSRNISLDLLFSDDEEDECPFAPPSSSEVIDFPSTLANTSEPKQVHVPHIPQPKRPVSIKRVGGGFRATAFTPAKSPVPTHAHAYQPPPRRGVRSLATTAVTTTTQGPLSQVTRRPSVQSGGHAPRRRNSADEAQLSPCDQQQLADSGPLYSESSLRQQPPTGLTATASAADDDDDDELALEELVEAYALAQVAD